MSSPMWSDSYICNNKGYARWRLVCRNLQCVLAASCMDAADTKMHRCICVVAAATSLTDEHNANLRESYINHPRSRKHWADSNKQVLGCFDVQPPLNSQTEKFPPRLKKELQAENKCKLCSSVRVYGLCSACLWLLFVRMALTPIPPAASSFSPNHKFHTHAHREAEWRASHALFQVCPVITGSEFACG